MEYKILPVAESPIHYHLHHAFALNIILNKKELIPWLHNEYIQLLAYGNNFYFMFADVVYDGYPILETKKIDPELLNDIEIIDFIIKSIDDDYYVLTNLNEKYLSYIISNNDFIHNVFIYGYDKNTHIFNMMGFNKGGKYGEVTASFDEVRIAYENRENKFEVDKSIYLIKTKTRIKYDLNLYNIYIRLYEYIYSYNSRNRDTLKYINQKADTATWGINCYKNLNNYYMNLYNTGDYGDIRIPHLIWEHKKVMLMRMEYMDKNGFVNNTQELCELYKPLVDNTLLMRNQILKYNMTLNKSVIQSIINELPFIESQEKVVLNRLLNEIRKNLYSEWIINAVINKSSTNRCTLFEHKHYITVICNCEETTDILSINNNIIHGRTIRESEYKENPDIYNELFRNPNLRLIIESDNAENIYSMPFRAEYLNVFRSKDDSMSNISLISGDIDKISGELQTLLSTSFEQPHFTVLYIKDNPIALRDIDHIINSGNTCSVEASDDFFRLYRNACGYEIDNEYELNNADSVHALTYSQQSGNCICGSSDQGSYITLHGESWIRFKNVKWVNNSIDYFMFYVSGATSNGGVQVVLNYLDGEVICGCIIEQSNGFQAYKCHLNEITVIEPDSYVDIFIKSSGDDDLNFNLHGYKFVMSADNTNSYYIDHTCFRIAENADIIAETENGLYSCNILLEDNERLSYDGLVFNKEFCEIEFAVENGCRGDVINVIIENDSENICKSIVLDNDNGIQKLYCSYSPLVGKYNLSLEYHPVYGDNVIRLRTIKCCLDVFDVVNAEEYSSCDNVQKNVLPDGRHIAGFTCNNSYICYSDVNFYKNCTAFKMIASNGNVNDDALIEIRIGSPDGKLLNELTVDASGDWDSFREYSCEMTGVSDRQDLYIISKGRENIFLVNLKLFRFE